MGQEIFYCSGCQTQLRSSDFEKGKAYKLLGLDAICAKCAPEALKTLPPEKLAALQKAMAGSGPPASSTPKSGTGRVPLATSTPKSGTGRVPLAASPSSTRKLPVVGEERNLKPVILIAVVLAVAVVGAVVALGGRKMPEGGPRTTTSPTPETPIPLPAGESARDRSAKEALRKAHVFADANPAEYLEQLRLFQEAATEAKGSGFEREVQKALESAMRRIQEAASARLKTLDEQSASACSKEEFRRASELIEDARRKPVTPDWSSEIDRRLQDVSARVDTAYGRVRTQALIAKPGSPEQKALRDRVAKWGIDRLVAELDHAIADGGTPPPAPTPAPAPVPAPAPTPAPPDAPKVSPAAEAEAFARSWTGALTLACGREFGPAIQELEKLQPSLQDPMLKSQAAADLEILRGAAALHTEALQAIARWPAGKKITLNFVDFDNNPQRVEGPMVRVRNGTIEIGKGKPIPQWPLGHLTPRSLADFAPGRNRITAAVVCLLEGDLAGAKELAGENNPAIPARYWKWGADVARPSDADAQKKEGDARYAYYFAVMNQGSPTMRAEAALKCRKLLEENGSLTWVRRNRAMLAAVAETTREYVAGPAALRQGGVFRLEVPKSLPYWMSDRDIDPAKRRDNYVEMDFSVLTDATYRAWAYVGVCCSESLVFYSQTTDLAGAEPGSEVDAPVKHALTSATKNHAGHSGRKGPSKWAWVELPLPKYEKPGAKVLRLLTGSQGFSVAFMVVSSLRDKPPGDADLKDWERDIVHNAGPVAPTIGLAAWFKADAGTVVEGGRIAQWQDQSGHGRHALQPVPGSRPTLAGNTLNGKPVVRFDGVSQVLSFDCPVNGLTGLTIFMVSAASKDLRTNELGFYAALHWGEFGPWGGVYLGPQQSSVAWRFGSGQFGNQPYWERPSAGWTLAVARKDGVRDELFVQGSVVQAPKDRMPSIAHTADTATIGGGSQGRPPVKFFAGDIAEILVFSRALTEAERDAIERYLRAKYGF